MKYNLECSASLFIVKVRSNKILTFRMSEDFVFKHHCTVTALTLKDGGGGGGGGVDSARRSGDRLPFLTGSYYGPKIS